MDVYHAEAFIEERFAVFCVRLPVAGAMVGRYAG
jgi:hypothetical protein